MKSSSKNLATRTGNKYVKHSGGGGAWCDILTWWTPETTYFQQTEKKDGRTLKLKDGGKMTEAGKEARVDTDPLTKADLLLITGKI